jgi:hypothetical protein
MAACQVFEKAAKYARTGGVTEFAATLALEKNSQLVERVGKIDLRSASKNDLLEMQLVANQAQVCSNAALIEAAARDLVQRNVIGATSVAELSHTPLALAAALGKETSLDATAIKDALGAIALYEKSLSGATPEMNRNEALKMSEQFNAAAAQVIDRVPTLKRDEILGKSGADLGKTAKE